MHPVHTPHVPAEGSPIEKRPDTLVLLNREAGTLRGDASCLDRVVRHGALDDADIRVVSGPDSIPPALRRAGSEGVRLVVVGGGDGTIHAVVNALVAVARASHRPASGDVPALAVLPLGTANDFARSLSVAELDDALDAIERERRQPSEPDAAGEGPEAGGARIVPIDLIRVALDGGRAEYAVNIVVAGFGGRVQHEITPELKARWGPLAYLVGSVGAFDGSGHSARIRIDDGEWHDVDFFNLAVANGRYAGGGYEAAPGARLDDGRVELLVASPVDLRELASLATHLRRGEPAEHDAVTLHGARRIRIETEDPLDYSLDGEPRSAASAELSVEQRAIRVLMRG